MIQPYIEAQIAYYEHGDYAFHRGFMIQAYESAYPMTDKQNLAATRGRVDAPRG